MFLSLQRGSEALHKGKILCNLCFELRNGNATLHMFLQEFVIALFEFGPFGLSALLSLNSLRS